MHLCFSDGSKKDAADSMARAIGIWGGTRLGDWQVDRDSLTLLDLRDVLCAQGLSGLVSCWRTMSRYPFFSRITFSSALFTISRARYATCSLVMHLTFVNRGGW